MKVNCTYEEKRLSWTPLHHEYIKHEFRWSHYPKLYKVADFPLKLDIELTNRCNRTCDMCAFHSKLALYKFPKEDMDLDIFKKIVDESEGKTTLKLNYSGEPLLYPHLLEAIRYAKDKGVIEVRFNTNADLLDTDMMHELIKAGLDRILISDYDNDDLKEKIVKFESIKQFFGVLHPIIVLQHIKFDGFNCQEYLDKWKDIETIEIGFQEYFDYLRHPLNLQKSDFQCAFPWQRMLILASGDIYTCCGMPHKRKLLGNIRHDSIKELWHGEKMTYLREVHKEKKSEKFIPCAMCPMRDKMVSKC